MPRSPLIVAAGLLVAGVVWALRLAFRPEPFSAGSASLVAFSLLATTLVAVGGMVVAHGRWSRRLALGVVGCEALLAAAMPLGVWTWAGIAALGIALVALTGPWLDGWLRRRPAAGGPPTAAMLVAVGGIALPGVVGASVPGSVNAARLALAATAVVAGIGFARAHGWGLWGMRLALPVAAVWAGVTSPWTGTVVISAGVAVVAAAAWRRESTLAVHPLMDVLPGPRRGRPGGARATP